MHASVDVLDGPALVGLTPPAVFGFIRIATSGRVLTSAMPVTGAKLTTDVRLAAHAIEQDAELFSDDTDFGRFPSLRWVDPLGRWRTRGAPSA